MRRVLLGSACVVLLGFGLYLLSLRTSQARESRRGHAEESGKVESLLRDGRGPGDAPGHNPSATSGTGPPPRLRLTWNRIPRAYSQVLVSCGAQIAPAGKARYPQWTEFLSDQIRAATLELTADAADEAIRALGVVAAVDFVLMREAGFQLGRAGFREYPEYVPLCVAGEPTISGDPNATISFLHALLLKPEAIQAKLPEQCLIDGITEGIKARALVLLTQVIPKEAAATLLLGELAKGDPVTEALSARLLASCGREDAVQSWAVGQLASKEPHECIEALRAARIGNLITGSVVDVPSLVKFGVEPPLRALDERLLEVAKSQKIEVAPLALLEVLIERADNPAVLAYLETIGKEPASREIRAALFKGAARLSQQPWIRDLIADGLVSSDVRLRVLALRATMCVPDAAVVPTLIRALDSDDDRVAGAAARGLYTCGLQDPKSVLDKLQSMGPQKGRAASVGFWIQAASTRMKRAIEEPGFVARERQALEAQAYRP